MALAPSLVAHNFPQKADIFFMRHQTKHYEIGIQSVHAMACIWYVQIAIFPSSNILHDLVFTFTRHVVARKDYGGPLPLLVFLDLYAYVLFNLLPQLIHELCTRGYAIRIKFRKLREILSVLFRFL